MADFLPTSPPLPFPADPQLPNSNIHGLKDKKLCFLCAPLLESIPQLTILKIWMKLYFILLPVFWQNLLVCDVANPTLVVIYACLLMIGKIYIFVIYKVVHYYYYFQIDSQKGFMQYLCLVVCHRALFEKWRAEESRTAREIQVNDKQEKKKTYGWTQVFAFVWTTGILTFEIVRLCDSLSQQIPN